MRRGMPLRSSLLQNTDFAVLISFCSWEHDKLSYDGWYYEGVSCDVLTTGDVEAI
jgi:hypothetical protein